MTVLLIVLASIFIYGWGGGITYYVARRAVIEHENNRSRYGRRTVDSLDEEQFVGVLLLSIFWPLTLPAVTAWRWCARHFDPVPESDEVLR